MTLLSRLGRRRGPNGKPLVTYGFRFHHQHRQYKQFFKTRALAVEGEKRLRAKLQLQAWEGEYGPLQPKLTPWAEAVQKYEDAKAAKRSLPFDQAKLTWWGDFFKGVGLHHLQEVSPEAIDRGKIALTALGKSPATIQRYLSTLKTLCYLAVDRWYLLRKNPVLSVDWPKATSATFPIPTPEEFGRLLSVCDPDLRAMVLIGALTGLREGDVLRIEAEDFRERPGWLKGRGSKGGKPVWLPVTPELQTVVESLGVAAGRIFRRNDGQPFRVFPRPRWNRARIAAGIPRVRFHDLRHAVGTILAEGGLDVETIRAYLGHADIRTTQIYMRASDRRLKQASRLLARKMGTVTRLTKRMTTSIVTS